MRHVFILFAIFSFAILVVGQTLDRDLKNRSKEQGIVSITGKSYGPAELGGKVVVLNFWYTSCPPCLKEIPELNQLVDEYRDQNVVFLGFAIDEKAEIERFLKENPFKYEIIPSAAQLMLRFLQPDKEGRLETKFPTHIVVDREGKRIVYETGIKGIEALRKELARQFPAETTAETQLDN
jgi:thiol-disulfide isomerase/thioredoxin